MGKDYRPFKIVSVLRDGSSVGITSAYDAAVFMLEKWPDEDGPKVRLARQILLNCLAGECCCCARGVLSRLRKRRVFSWRRYHGRPRLEDLIRNGASAKLLWQGTADPNSRGTQKNHMNRNCITISEPFRPTAVLQ
ncbi:DUF982 domain-containing protein [Phyllobacterium brassicacearum]|uniref:DUF982 domain-containing protein n=1 Tax=Phyllobacterium brassicacearum TaxID=314235 RepID=UPI000D10D1BE